MPCDPRTPVLVGVGQVVQREPGALGGAEADALPARLMVEALRVAAGDASTRAASPGALLERADALGVVASLGWRPKNPAAVVAGQLGISPRRLLCTATGGNGPLSLLHHLYQEIAGGRMALALVTGAEAFHTVASARRAGAPLPPWLGDHDEGGGTPEMVGDERAPATDLEAEVGLRFPVHAYALMEHALRGAAGRSLSEQAEVTGALWHRFNQVAMDNPYAWLRRRLSAHHIVSGSPTNRPVASPYTKLCTANMQVDQGAAAICCSLEVARSLGVPDDRMVFPWSGAEASDHWFLSERQDLHSSPAIRLAGRDVLRVAGRDIDDVAQVDLYSCFPSVVQIAAHELGLPLDDPGRPLTVTGGLTFAGGPGNNYATHSLATMVERLRHAPSQLGLVTALGWYATKHAVGLYAARPRSGSDGPAFSFSNVQRQVDALPAARWSPSLEGPVEVETYTATYARSGRPDHGIVVCRDLKGTRSWAAVTDEAQLEELSTADVLGRRGTLEGRHLALA